MEFKSADDAHNYFNKYACLAGFAAVRAHHARTQSKKETMKSYESPTNATGKGSKIHPKKETHKRKRYTHRGTQMH
jgi:hypothetical protein